MPFFNHDGLSFHYLDSGSGTPFVFQHGLGATVQQPHDLYRARPGLRFIAMDCRFHGQTNPLGDERQLTFDNFANDLLALLKSQGLHKAVIGGISLGAGVALNFAARHPERALGLVLSRPAWLDRPMPDNLRGLSIVASYIRRHGAADGLARFRESDAYADVRRQSPDSAESLLAQFTNTRAEEAVARLERVPNDAPTRARAVWSGLRLPTLVLATRGDLIHPYGYGEALAQAIPGAVLKELTPKSVSPERYQSDTRDCIEAFVQQRFA